MDALEAHLQRQLEHSRNFFWHRVRWQAVEEQFQGSTFTVTDVGAGIGLVGEFLSARYPQATYRFVEPLQSLVVDLESRFGIAANANESVAYQDSQYITLLDVLEHIEDDRQFLADLAAKMSPGATLVMTVPALGRLWSTWDVALGHYRRYDRQMARERFAGLPLKVREISYIFPEMLPPALVRRRTRRADSATETSAETAEFPDLPSAVNEALYRVSSATLAARRFWPAGTSLLVVAER